MAEDIEQQLRLTEQELLQVQDQISSLLEHQERLQEQRDELHIILHSLREGAEFEGNGTAHISQKQKQNWSGAFEWDQQADDLRLNIFGIPSYRTNQREIINAVLSGRDVVVIMAAGGGKSLCYQLPALLRHGTALVISPLISLIQDQVMGLTSLGISASMLTSTSKDEEKAIYHALEKGEEDVKILYVTPEKIAKSKRFMSKLEKCNHAGRLSLIAIDEAHCCSQWGHDFRPDYKNLGILKKQFPKVPMIALTATATERVQTDLREMLQISSCERFVSSVNRPNLFYEVREKKSNASAAVGDIADFIRENFDSKESGIVYCLSRKECEQVAKELRKKKISASHYHADMDPGARESVHKRWSSNKLQVIVGTVAFGMGINKPDVRFVIHHSLSKSLETYYQESGRAGRDGLPSQCVLFFRPADLPRQSCMVFAEVAGLHNLYSIARFCLSRRACRHAAFFRHFGETAQECNGMCDNCAYTKNVVDMDITAHARSLVTLVKDLEAAEKKQTMLQLADTWRSRSRQAESQQQDEAKLVKDLNKEDVERMIAKLVLEGVLKEEFQHTAYSTNSYICLGSGWRSLIQGNKKVTLEVIQGTSTAKKKASSVQDKGTMTSGLGQMLCGLRQGLANDQGGIFPHTILSSQHISLLCARRHGTLEELEEVIGKRKVEQYGEAILSSIQAYLAKNPQSPPTTGEWACPKQSKSPGAAPSASRSPQRQSFQSATKASNIKAQQLAARQKAPANFSKKRGASENPELISLDTDSDDSRPTDAQVEEDDDDFELFRPVKRRKPST